MTWSLRLGVVGGIFGLCIGVLVAFTSIPLEDRGFGHLHDNYGMGGPVRGYDPIARQASTENIARLAELKIAMGETSEGLQILLSIDEASLLANAFTGLVAQHGIEMLSSVDESVLTKVRQRVDAIKPSRLDQAANTDRELPPVRNDLRRKAEALLQIAKIYALLGNNEEASNAAKSAQVAALEFQRSLKKREEAGISLELAATAGDRNVPQFWRALAWPAILAVLGFVVSGVSAPILEAVGKHLVGPAIAEFVKNPALSHALQKGRNGE